MRPYHVLAVLGLFCATCDKPESEPVYPPEPFITTGKVIFIDPPAPDYAADTLVLEFDFRDGDFDLGLERTDIDSPHHYVNFFLEKNGNLEHVKTQNIGNYLAVTPFPAQNGKLVTYKHALTLLAQPPSFNCTNYLNDFIYVASDKIIDASYNITDTVMANGNSVFMLRDTFLIERNVNHYNLEVDYYVENSNGGFDVFDWSQFCTSFDARFFLLENMPIKFRSKNGPFSIYRSSKQTGSVRYAMASTRFKTLFGGKKVKLRFSIKDRALNQSNTLETDAIVIPQ
jgi:hypothetical protein